MSEFNKLVSPTGPVIAFSPSLARDYGPCGALLIQQIHFWAQAKPHRSDGRDWYYNTYEAWAEQLGVWSVKTIKRKMADLERAGVVVSGCFNKHGYDRTKWYRIDYDVLALPSHSAKMASSSCHGDTIHSDSLAPPIPKSNTEGIQESKMVGQSPPHPADPLLQEDEEEMKKHKNSAEEVLKAFKASKASPATMDKHNPKALELLWCKLVPEHCDSVKYTAPFTQAELGMLGRLGKMWGATTPYVIESVLKEWIAFTKYTETMDGAFKTPMAPSVAFLNKYAKSAMNFHLVCLSEQTSHPVPAKSPPAVQLAALSKSSVGCVGEDDDDDHIATLEEVNAIYKEIADASAAKKQAAIKATKASG